MSLNTKRWVARVVIIILGVWPLCHFAITKSRGLEPWKLAGFAMYTVPRFSTQLRLFGVREGIPYALSGERISDETLETASRYLILRRTLNPELAPDEVARQLFRDFPEYSDLLIEVIRLELDLSDGMLKTRGKVYDYSEENAASQGAGARRDLWRVSVQVSAIGSPLSRSFTAC